MFTINFKRSVAALAVTAGLLAAAAPASHAHSSGVSQTGTASVKAPGSCVNWGMQDWYALKTDANDAAIVPSVAACEHGASNR
jgi:hypothetical protein